MKIFYTLVLAFSLLLTVQQASASDFEEGGIAYLVTSAADQTCEVTSKAAPYEGAVCIPATVDYNGKSYSVKSIGSHAFENAEDLCSVTIPASVASIGAEAFAGCPNLYKVILLPLSVPQGLEEAFTALSGRVAYVCSPSYTSQAANLGKILYYAHLSGLFVQDGVSYVPVSQTEARCDAIDCSYSPACTALSVCENVVNEGKTYTVADIKDYCFYGNTNLVTVDLDHSGNVGAYAFGGCTSLDSLTLAGTVSIGANAFSKCYALQYVALGTNLESIGDCAFEACTALVALVTGNATPPSCNATAFQDLNKTNLKVWRPSAVKQAYRSAAGWKTLGNFQDLYVLGMVLRVVFSDGQTVSCSFSDHPVLSFPSEKAIVLTSKRANFQLSLDDVDYWAFDYNYATAQPSAIGKTGLAAADCEVDAAAKTLRVAGTKGTKVRIYALDGTMLLSCPIPATGKAEISFGNLPKGIYILRSGLTTLKFSTK